MTLKRALGWVLFSARMAVWYGPRLWKIGREIYDRIEKRRVSGRPLCSEAKALAFDRELLAAWLDLKSSKPTRAARDRFRENVWKAKNPGLEPKPLEDDLMSEY